MSSPSTRYVVSGWAAAARRLTGGIREIIRVFLPGEPIETEPAERLPYDVLFAGSHARVVTLNLAAFPDCPAMIHAERREALRLLASHTARLSRMDSLARCSHALLDIDARLRLVAFDGTRAAPFAITQSQLGDYLGLSNVHVNRTVRRLRTDGLATVKPKLEILDRSTMKGLCSWSPIDEPWATSRPDTPRAAPLTQAG